MTRTRCLNPLLLSLFLAISATLLACAEDTGDEGDGETADAGGAGGSEAGAGGSAGADPVDEMLADLEEAGLFEYLGQYTPSSEETVGNVTKYRFAVEDGSPQCIDSSEFGVAVRDQGSENLVIFLMGGGACWTGFNACTQSVGLQINMLDNDGGLIMINPTDTDFPTASWNHVMVPYCDGSVFIGDREVDLFDESTAAWASGTEVLYGLRNLSAALDVAKSSFPEATRILVTGTSAGGFGTIGGAGLVRKLWREAEIMVFNDAGLGVLKTSDPSFTDWIKNEWNIGGLLPASCDECQTSTHMTPVVAWGLERDPMITATGAFSSYGDMVIAGVFLSVTEEEFKTSILEETDRINAAFPDRFRRFFIEGTQHTIATGNWELTAKEGTTVKAWLTAMIDGDLDGWVDLP